MLVTLFVPGIRDLLQPVCAHHDNAVASIAYTFAERAHMALETKGEQGVLSRTVLSESSMFSLYNPRSRLFWSATHYHVESMLFRLIVRMAVCTLLDSIRGLTTAKNYN